MLRLPNDLSSRCPMRRPSLKRKCGTRSSARQRTRCVSPATLRKLTSTIRRMKASLLRMVRAVQLFNTLLSRSPRRRSRRRPAISLDSARKLAVVVTTASTSNGIRQNMRLCLPCCLPSTAKPRTAWSVIQVLMRGGRPRSSREPQAQSNWRGVRVLPRPCARTCAFQPAAYQQLAARTRIRAGSSGLDSQGKTCRDVYSMPPQCEPQATPAVRREEIVRSPRFASPLAALTNVRLNRRPMPAALSHCFPRSNRAADHTASRSLLVLHPACLVQCRPSKEQLYRPVSISHGRQRR